LGKIYVRKTEEGVKLGLASFHLSDDIEKHYGTKEINIEKDLSQLDKMEETKSYLNYSLMSSNLKSDDERRYPKKKFLKGAYYDESRRAFHCWMDWRTQIIDKGTAAKYFKIVFAPDFKSFDHGSSE
jgi:hypothetical protein